MTLPFETAGISSKHLNRRNFIGGSDARIIMGSDEAALLRLWREKRGKAEPEDLSDNLIVQLGLVTEPLNRQWFERHTGRVITQVQRRGPTPGAPGCGAAPRSVAWAHGAAVPPHAHPP